MIQINFPPDPSILVFILDHDIASVYLLARAVQHYGADKLSVIDRTHINHKASRQNPFKMSWAASIVDRLGLKDIRYLTLNPGVNLQYTNPVDSVQTQSHFRTAILNIFKRYNVAIDQFDGSMSGIMTIIAILQSLGRMDAAGNEIENNCVLAFAQTLQDDGSSSQARDIIKQIPSYWAPLVDYCTVDILKSAQKEGLMDLISMIHYCTYDLPTPCGVCNKCVNWKMRLIESEVV